MPEIDQNTIMIVVVAVVLIGGFFLHQKAQEAKKPKRYTGPRLDRWKRDMIVNRVEERMYEKAMAEVLDEVVEAAEGHQRLAAASSPASTASTAKTPAKRATRSTRKTPEKK